jgi:hypothetical protein
MFLYVVDCPFRVVLLSVRVEVESVTLFFHSTTTHSDLFEINSAWDTIILAVE